MATTIAQNRIKAARDAIGTDTQGDYDIPFAEHATLYEQTAPDLALRLGQSDVRAVARQYQESNDQAKQAQVTFSRTADRARSAVFVAGIGGASLIATGTLTGLLGRSTRPLTVAFTIIGAAAAGVAAALIGAIKGGKLLEDWMTARARAESLRMKYFDMVSRERLLPEPLLQLEYFRRYQLEVQCAYFKTKATTHRRAANKALWMTAGAMAVTSIAMVLAGSLSTLNVMWTSLAAVGLVSQAFSAFVENREATAQSRRNAERFTRTRQTLEDLIGRLDEVRAATSDGHPEVMQEFIGAVQEQISLEHRQWLDDSKSKGEAIGRLEVLLQDYEKQRRPVAAASPSPPSAHAPAGATKT